jgi:electron transport complex protein RnfB
MTYVVAKINEDNCIGCMLCITACPFDAIIGASKQLHTVLETACTGCKLCLPPCPTSCIEFIPLENQTKNKANHLIYKTRHRDKKTRDQKNQEKIIQKHVNLTDISTIKQTLAKILNNDAK